jgi:diacylglycerol kinase (ATP)
VKHVFIVNPVSGKADASLYLVPKILDAVKQAGVDYAIELTTHGGHAKELAQAYAQREEPVRLYACGGDGTLNEVFEGVWRVPGSRAEVASVPCGSGNDFVRNFGEPEDFLNLSDNVAGSAIPIDLMETGRGISAAICSVGIDAEIAYGIPKFRRIPLCGGTMAYNLSIVQRLCSHMGRRLRIELDGKVFEDEYLIATVCNGSSYGGGYKAAPTADLQDGSLEVVLVGTMGRLRLAKILGQYKVGKHISEGEVVQSMRDVMQYHHAHEVHIVPTDGKPAIVNIDGECGPALDLYARVLPLAARFVLPASIYANFESHAVEAAI